MAFILFMCIAVGIFVSAGCVTPTPSVTPTPTQTTLPPTTLPPTTVIPTTTAPITTMTPSLTPGPTVTVPIGFETNIGITVDDVTRTILVRYNGGMSQILLQRIDTRVTTESGRVVTRSITNEEDGIPRQIPVGYTFEIRGDRGINRIEVTVTINGVSYKVSDTTVQFR